MAVINLLDVQTSNLIAAGEVVERPANVLKELLENAIDAKSTAIVTEITGGGVESIRVTDNGCGMAKEDLPLSIRRHATSKIKTGADLAAISTLGFRGEALAAISSTSRFTVMSKMRDAALGHQMTVEGEEVLSLEECGCADGTTVIVQDLFFNQPARRKFLKRAQTESAAILQYIQRIAVSHPEIAFRHSADGVVKLQTIGNGKLGDGIYSVYGKEFASSLVEVDHKEGPFLVKGYITRPEMARNNHNYQSFYINKRYVKSRTMQFAMEDAYKSFVKSEKFPGCVLFLDIDPGEVDVNVHPAKLEVRFSDERGVYSAVFAAVRKTLSSLSNRLAKENYERAVLLSQQKKDVVVPKISETRPPLTPSAEVKIGTFHETKKELPLFSPAPSRGKSPLVFKEEKTEMKTVTVKEADFTKDGIPPARENSEPMSAVPENKPITPKAILKAEEETFTQGTVIGLEELAGAVKKDNPLTELGSVQGVVFNAFILYETKEKLYLIDKHAAHERILYESLKKNHKTESVQLFLEPLFFDLSPVDAAYLRDHLKELEEAGFLLEEFSDHGFLLRGIPLEFTSLSGDAVISILESAASELRLGGKASGAGEKKFDRTLYSMACKAAVKAGIPSTESDHEWIVEKIREIDNIIVCPHGRPILVSYTKKEIENLFLRT
ncbi:MAG: DNA mismatch repair endonuclease MutL [Clostridia bacterium]|nr:DNA mismatch repair endonuclease MutL [Clostridia bacterium]